ncbi:MAG TPA: energy transducer TonB [Thermoanaerobaculia bacterium]|nr:energy transducer TonB [Thermoanaerobaculia bacterium]
MFDTLIPKADERKSFRRRMAETLPVSISVHAVAAGSVLFAAMSQVNFPDQPPALVRSYMIASTPPPPPPPPPPPRAASAPRVTPPKQLFAPTVVPDTIAEVPKEAPAEVVSDVNGDGVEGGVPGGEMGGVVGGVVGGVPTEAPPPPPDDRLYVDKKEKLPMVPVEQPYPAYPEKMRKTRKEGLVTVRYVVGKDGRVTEVTILDADTESAFNEATLEAIRRWRFRPYKKEGKPIEVVHELSVFFTLVWRSR